MMLDMVVHMPVNERQKWIEDDCTGTQAEIRHIILQTGMLRVIAQEEEPTTIEGSQGDQNRYLPQAKGK